MSEESKVSPPGRTRTDNVKPSALRSILAGALAGAVEIGTVAHITTTRVSGS